MGVMRSVFLAVLVADLALVAAGIAAYPSYWRQPGSVGYLAGPVVLLVAYGVAVVAATRSADRRRVLRVAAIVGLATGLLEVANIAVETFAALSGPANLAATAPFILGPFAVWAMLAGWVARATGELRLGLLAAVFGAMVTMVTGVTFGFALALVAPGRLSRILATDPDFVRSGWTDVRAYVLANAFDNGLTHLLGALLVGAIVGLLGGAVGARLARA